MSGTARARVRAVALSTAGTGLLVGPTAAPALAATSRLQHVYVGSSSVSPLQISGSSIYWSGRDARQMVKPDHSSTLMATNGVFVPPGCTVRITDWTTRQTFTLRKTQTQGLFKMDRTYELVARC